MKRHAFDSQEDCAYRLLKAFHMAAERDNKVQVIMGEKAQKEASAMTSISIITMIFLPATFISVRYNSIHGFEMGVFDLTLVYSQYLAWNSSSLSRTKTTVSNS